MIRRLALFFSLAVLACVAVVLSLGTGWFGNNENAGTPQLERVMQSVLDERLARQRQVAPAGAGQILFGDLHVHTTFSYDAFLYSLPATGGPPGPHTVADACDYARYCSALDFWAVSDHAEQLTPRMWHETVETVKLCNALAGSEDNPDLVTFLGWEWTPSGDTATARFGHNKVLLRDVDRVPGAPIAAPGQGSPLPPRAARGVAALAAGDARARDLNRYLAELDAAAAVKEIARDPRELMTKLDDLGLEALLIPHGLAGEAAGHRDAWRPALVELFSGLGSTERPAGTGRCADCLAPVADEQGRGTVQYRLAVTDFNEADHGRRHPPGFIAASGNHSARPGPGYKPGVHSGAGVPLGTLPVNWEELAEIGQSQPQRLDAVWYAGGLVAIHADSRRREAIWEALRRRETYATSGPRMLLWFDLVDENKTSPMGSVVARAENPRFRVRVLGAFEQEPGCPAHAVEAAGARRLQALCENECYHPGGRRHRIDRMEIVRVRPQTRVGEPIEPLIENTWRVWECPRQELACEFTFTDPDFASAGRDTLYYVRAVQAVSNQALQGRQGCGDGRSGCNSPLRHRAWSSPIFVNFRGDPARSPGAE